MSFHLSNYKIASERPRSVPGYHSSTRFRFRRKYVVQSPTPPPTSCLLFDPILKSGCFLLSCIFGLQRAGYCIYEATVYFLQRRLEEGCNDSSASTFSQHHPGLFSYSFPQMPPFNILFFYPSPMIPVTNVVPLAHLPPLSLHYSLFI